eukprot:scaffold754_cov248-Pinguiococcus_pyrenoidosus.AAC.28
MRDSLERREEATVGPALPVHLSQHRVQLMDRDGLLAVGRIHLRSLIVLIVLGSSDDMFRVPFPPDAIALEGKVVVDTSSGVGVSGEGRMGGHQRRRRPHDRAGGCCTDWRASASFCALPPPAPAWTRPPPRCNRARGCTCAEDRRSLPHPPPSRSQARSCDPSVHYFMKTNTEEDKQSLASGRSATYLIDVVDVCAVLQQQFHNPDVPESGGQNQRRRAVLISDIYARAVLHDRTRDGEVASSRRP